VSDNPLEECMAATAPLFWLAVLLVLAGIIGAFWAIYLFFTSGEVGAPVIILSALAIFGGSGILLRNRRVNGIP